MYSTTCLIIYSNTYLINYLVIYTFIYTITYLTVYLINSPSCLRQDENNLSFTCMCRYLLNELIR